jgi:glycosyltransferase involved in cell wall biosynthesis
MAQSTRKDIWLIKVAEPTPLDGRDVRLFRSGLLAAWLAERGHNVTWWQSTVNHQKKQQRFLKHTTVALNDNLKIIFLHSILYKRNAGILRIINQYNTARAFAQIAEKSSPPDIIVCCLPPLELCVRAVEYGKRHCIPVVLDVQDLWPDAFMKFVPSWLQAPWRLLLTPWFNAVKKACSQATALIGTTDAFVSWALNYAGRTNTPNDKAFPFGYPEAAPPKAAIEEAQQLWASLGISNDPGQFIACFFGVFGRHYELDVIIEAARKLQHDNRQITFVLCGTGDNLEEYKRRAHDCRNIIFPGWVGEAEIWTLLRKSAVGLAPYRKSFTLSRNLTNKPIEYLSAGLPVISSLEGVLEDLLRTHQCGITYAHGDADGLVSILREACDNPGALHAMSENAYALFKKYYTAEKVYGEMCDYFESMCGDLS